MGRKRTERVTTRLNEGKESEAVRGTRKGKREEWGRALPDVQVQQDLLFSLTRVNFDSKDAQWLERDEGLGGEGKGGVPQAPLGHPSPLSHLSFLHTYLFTQFHSCKCKCLQVGVGSSNSWGHSFSQKLLHILAQEGPDLSHNLGGKEADHRKAQSSPLKACSFRILPTGRPELKCACMAGSGKRS